MMCVCRNGLKHPSTTTQAQPQASGSALGLRLSPRPQAQASGSGPGFQPPRSTYYGLQPPAFFHVIFQNLGIPRKGIRIRIYSYT